MTLNPKSAAAVPGRACGKRIVWTLRRRLLRPDQLQAALEKLASPGLRRKAREVRRLPAARVLTTLQPTGPPPCCMPPSQAAQSFMLRKRNADMSVCQMQICLTGGRERDAAAAAACACMDSARLCQQLRKQGQRQQRGHASRGPCARTQSCVTLYITVKFGLMGGKAQDAGMEAAPVGRAQTHSCQ